MRVNGGGTPSRRDAVGAVEAGRSAANDVPVAAGAEPQRPTEVDPDDTSRCPVAQVCECCQVGEDVSVGTAESAVGIFCMSLCGPCAESGRLPRFRPLEAVTRVQAHAGHLGCTVDDLAGGAL